MMDVIYTSGNRLRDNRIVTCLSGKNNQPSSMLLKDGTSAKDVR